MNRFFRFLASLAAALTLASLTAASLHAGQVTGFNWFSGVASLAATSIVPPVAINNNDAVGLSPNEIFVTQKNYVGIGPVDIVFDVSNSGGVTEYAVKEGVYNGTGVPWLGYHIELGFGHDAGFVKSLPGDGLDFDAPDYNSGLQFNPAPGFFPTAVATEDDIIASGGVMGPTSFAGYFRFSVDVPDGITSFTVRQSPLTVIVPEPAAWALATFAVIAPLTLRRRMATIR